MSLVQQIVVHNAQLSHCHSYDLSVFQAQRSRGGRVKVPMGLSFEVKSYTSIARANTTS